MQVVYWRLQGEMILPHGRMPDDQQDNQRGYPFMGTARIALEKKRASGSERVNRSARPTNSQSVSRALDHTNRSRRESSGSGDGEMDFSPKGERAGASESIEVRVRIPKVSLVRWITQTVPGGNRTHI